MVCSPFAAGFLRAGHVPVFSGVPVNKIMPRDFRLIPEVLADVTSLVVPALLVALAPVQVGATIPAIG
jgi:hypothetical protein